MRLHEAAQKLIIQERLGDKVKDSSYWPVPELTRAELALGRLHGPCEEVFVLSPIRSCMISFGAASCSLMTSSYRCYCLVSPIPFCIGVTCSPARSVLDLSLDTYLYHRSQLPCTDSVVV